ncbi:beta-propeller fold lactonase family protein [Weissella halotolerans]
MDKVLIGTYTMGASKGIYELDFDDENGYISNVRNIAQLGSPTYLAVSAADKLYTVDRDGDHGGLAVYDFSKDGETEFIASYMEGGSSPAYVAVDEQRQLVYTANYHKGTVKVFAIHDDGTLTLTDSFKSSGQGPRPEQDKSHIHFANLTPDNRLVAVDLGTDKVFTFDVSAEGKLTQVAEYNAESGFGPRHIRFSKDGQYAYLLGELSSKLAVLKYNQHDGTFKLLQEISTIPTDWHKHNGAAAIYVSDDGHFIYTSNRGHNSIAVFEIKDGGAKVERIQLISSEGDFPRDFALSPSNRYLIVANQNTDNLSVYERSSKTGKLTLIQKNFVVPEGVRVVFK